MSTNSSFPHRWCKTPRPAPPFVRGSLNRRAAPHTGFPLAATRSRASLSPAVQAGMPMTAQGDGAGSPARAGPYTFQATRCIRIAAVWKSAASPAHRAALALRSLCLIMACPRRSISGLVPLDRISEPITVSSARCMLMIVNGKSVGRRTLAERNHNTAAASAAIAARVHNFNLDPPQELCARGKAR